MSKNIAFKDPGKAFDCKERVPVVGFGFGGLGDSEWEKNEKNLVSWDLKKKKKKKKKKSRNGRIWPQILWFAISSTGLGSIGPIWLGGIS